LPILEAKDIGITYFTVNTIAESVREEMATYNWDTAQLETAGNWKFKTLTKNYKPAAIIYKK